MQFRVWAPHATTVGLQLAGGEEIPLQEAGGGWWQANLSDAGLGTRYGYRIDGSPPLPDPRSKSQPKGVHGLSEVIDHGAFVWSDRGWTPPPLSSGVVYEMHTGTFTEAGTFEAAIHKLDHLVDLGITHLELLPVAEFPGRRGWGYDGVDLFAPHHAYGGPDGLKRLVDAAHGRGLAVLLDVVYNHLGPDGNYLEKFGPYFTSRYQTPWGEAVNLDGPGSDEVRRFIIDNACMWLRDYHFDGLRLDAVHTIVDTSAVHILEELSWEIDRLEAELGRHLSIIAESDLNDPRVITPRQAGGYGIDAQWNDDFHHALHSLLTGERHGYYSDFGQVSQLAKSLQQGYVYDGGYSPARGRRHGRPPVGIPARRFLGYLQNHDQIGNRANGDRSSHLLSPGLLQAAAALVLASPFIPMLFQGEEWGATSPFRYFTDHEDRELAEAVRAGRVKEFSAFGWRAEDVPDPQAEETYCSSKLNWDERHEAAHAGLLDWHRRLIALRKIIPALSAGGFENTRVLHDDEGRWLILERGPVRVICNFSREVCSLTVDFPERTEILLASAEVRPGEGQIEIPPESATILAPRLG